MKTNNIQVCKRLTIPDSFAKIENCNPNHIMLKICIRNLIMWDCISDTEDFLYS